jgi:hypothetical protein
MQMCSLLCEDDDFCALSRVNSSVLTLDMSASHNFTRAQSLDAEYIAGSLLIVLIDVLN